MKRFFFFLSIIILVAAIYLLATIPLTSGKIIEELKTQANSVGVILNLKELDLKLPSEINFNSLSLIFPIQRTPIPLLIDTGQINLRILPLLRFKLIIGSLFKLYQGTLTLNASKSLFNSQLSTTAHAEKIQLSDHPAAKLFGVTGELAFDLNLQTNLNKEPLPNSTQLELVLQNGSYLGGHSINGLLTLPSINDIEINITALQRDQRIGLNKILFSSSMGTITGNGNIRLITPGILDKAEFDLKIKLTPEAQSIFEPYLALAAKLPSNTSADEWTASISLIRNEPPFIEIRPN